MANDYEPVTSRSTWIALSAAVGSLWIAVGSILGIFALFRGHHSEALHGFVSACFLAVLLGTPILSVIISVVSDAARRREEEVPRSAVYARILAWTLLVILMILILIPIALVLRQ